MPTKKPSDEVTEFIAHTIATLLREGTYPSMVKLHADLRFEGKPSRTQLANIVDGTRGAGMDTIKAFARKFYGGSIDELEKAAHAFALEHGLVRVVEEERYPNRARAERALVELGNDPADVRRWSEAVAVSLDADQDPDAESWWLAQIQAQRSRERAARKDLTQRELPGRALEVPSSRGRKKRV